MLGIKLDDNSNNNLISVLGGFFYTPDFLKADLKTSTWLQVAVTRKCYHAALVHGFAHTSIAALLSFTCCIFADLEL